MKENETALKSAAVRVGIWLFLSWVIVVGPVGFLLLCGLAYAMYFSNLALGMVCGLLIFSPLLFAAVWLPLCGAALIEERSAERVRLASQAV
jgi:hypothetical protein